MSYFSIIWWAHVATWWRVKMSIRRNVEVEELRSKLERFKSSDIAAGRLTANTVNENLTKQIDDLKADIKSIKEDVYLLSDIAAGRLTANTVNENLTKQIDDLKADIKSIKEDVYLLARIVRAKVVDPARGGNPLSRGAPPAKIPPLAGLGEEDTKPPPYYQSFSQ